MHDRGASEVLGFVLVFSLIAASTGIVYGVGFTGLEDARDAERVQNAERAFDVLADNVDDVVQDRAPARATEIKLADASVGVGEKTRIEVVAGSTYAVETRPVVFQLSGSDASVVYEAGGVIRTDNDAGVFKRDPQFILDDDRTVLAIPGLESSAPGQIGGSTTALVRTDRIGSAIRADETPTSSITIRVETTTVARAEAWERYLEGEIRAEFAGAGPDPCNIPAGTTTVECSAPPPNRLVVTLTRMHVEVE